MSIQASLWAQQSAPTKDMGEWAVLVAMAGAADDDGTGCYKSRETLGRIVKADPKTIGRKQAEMERRGLIARGDQSRVAHIPADKRPVVWDLLIPFDWFPDVEETNQERLDRGRPELSPEDRPRQAPAPARKRRKDLGITRPERRIPDGGTESPVGNQSGGTESPVAGGLQVPSGGTQSPTTQSFTQSTEELPSAAANPRPPGPVDNLPARAIVKAYTDRCSADHAPVAPRVRSLLVAEVRELLAAGFSPDTVTTGLDQWRSRNQHPRGLAPIVQQISGDLALPARTARLKAAGGMTGIYKLVEASGISPDRAVAYNDAVRHTRSGIMDGYLDPKTGKIQADERREA